MKKFEAIKIVILLCFFGMSQTLFSQENNPKQTEKNEKQDVKKGTLAGGSAIKVKASTSNSSGNGGNIQTPVDTQGKSFQLDENDPYQGRKDEFLAQITLKELPQDFPKYEKWMGVRHYNQIIDEYYKKHLDILIPVLKQKLSGR
jgi:hypothetical protein